MGIVKQGTEMLRAKVKRVDGTNDFVWWTVWCPGCDDIHHYDERWTFNGDMNKPTFTPEYLAISDHIRCHSFLTDGRMRFLSDCTHSLAGKTVDIPEFPEQPTTREGWVRTYRGAEEEGNAHCPHCGEVERCREPNGDFLPIGMIHRSRGLAAHGIDCLGCHRKENW